MSRSPTDTAALAPIRVVTHVPGRPWGARAAGSARTLVGYVLLVLGVIVAIPTAGLAALLALAITSGDFGNITAWAALAGGGALTAALVGFGQRIARGRRHLVLFLRRFGFNDASYALTFAVTGAMGRRWRLATLDDRQVEAVGTHRGERALWGVTRWLALLGFAAVLFAAARWWFGDGVDTLIGGLFDQIYENAEANGANAFEAFMAAFIGTLAGAVAILALTLLFGVFALSSLGVASVALWAGDRAIRRAEVSRALTIDGPAEVAPRIDRIREATRRIKAPRLIVAKVDDGVWRDVVRRLAEEASAAIVDVSDPTDHLVWEVRLLQTDIRARLIAIGRRDRVEALARGTDLGGPAATLRQLLAGEEVLVYDQAADRRAMRTFARNLMATLNAVRA